jgi:hypothetical protein
MTLFHVLRRRDSKANNNTVQQFTMILNSIAALNTEMEDTNHSTGYELVSSLYDQLVELAHAEFGIDVQVVENTISLERQLSETEQEILAILFDSPDPVPIHTIAEVLGESKSNSIAFMQSCGAGFWQPVIEESQDYWEPTRRTRG